MKAMKKSKLICRCCAANGPFKAVVKKYNWMGEDEVYSVMLKECFNITVDMEGMEETSGICECCIAQLRNAFNFKKQVLLTESRLKNRIPNQQLTEIVAINNENSMDSEEFDDTEIVVEMLEDIDDDSDYRDDNQDNDTEYSADSDPEPPKKKSSATTSKGKKTFIKSTPKPKLVKKENEHLNELRKRKEDSHKYKVNIREILLHTNANLIKTHTDLGYYCAFCIKIFKEVPKLKKHAITNHVKDIPKLTTRTISYLAKMDITDLKCIHCDENFDTISGVLQHLKIKHRRTVHPDVDSSILPLKFSDGTLNCAICGFYSEHFHTLLTHMHVHFNKFKCSLCSNTYANRNAYSMHLQRVHPKKLNLKCTYCELEFPNDAHKSEHEKRTHLNVRRLVCRRCDVRFGNHDQKLRHMAEEHGIGKSISECEYCDKKYKNKATLIRHIKRDHLNIRNQICEICGEAFYFRTELRDHVMNCHTEEKAIVCKICNRKYVHHRSLSKHMRISHSGVKK